MHGLRAWILAIGLFFCAFGPGRAHAFAPESAAPEVSAEIAPAGYQQAAALGFLEFERGNYEEARARFLQAYRLWPNARILRALGHCEFELEHYVAAVEFLEQTLVSSVRPLDETQRRDTDELLGRARSHVARCTVHTQPRDAQVLIDGVEAKRDVSGAVLLAAGVHAVEAHAPGYQVGQREVTIEGGVDRVLQLELSPVPPQAMTEVVPLRKKWWLWTGVAVAGAVGLATVLALSLRDPGEGNVDGGSTDMVIPVGRSDGARP